MKHFPTLYKKTSTGAIQFWHIYVIPHPDHSAGYEIYTEYGQVETSSPQLTVDAIFEGKNIGKKNETTPEQQAFKEAESRWKKQKKKGYVESIEAAEAEETDSLIEGGVVPMLAQKFSAHGHKIKYPCYVQPKLDGIRCIAIVKDGRCTLWSRTRKRITSVPHIERELENAFRGRGEITLDGELYNHEMKADFEKIVSLVRQENPGEGHEMVQYHIYDLVNSVSPFSSRTEVIKDMFKNNYFIYCKFVHTDVVEHEDFVMDHFNSYRLLGYEGAMLRNADSLYVNKRSYDLQKVKEFDDAEFRIVGIEEGRGKLTGHVGAFICLNDKGKEFKAKAKGSTEKLAEYFQNHSLWTGKWLTVQYQGLTGKEKVPRFPVGIAIRDYE